MNVSIRFIMDESDLESPEDVFTLAGGGDWRSFTEWAESLGPGLVRQLAVEGSAKGTDKLAAELRAALLSHPPDPYVRSVAERVLELIMTGQPGETALVTDEE